MSDIDTAAVDSLKALDPNRPIREADMYFDVQNASQLSGVFSTIAQNLANLRLAK